MNKFGTFKNIKSKSTFLFLVFFISACAAPLGTVSLHTINNDGSLSEPLMDADVLQGQDAIGTSVVYKSTPDTSASGDDVFSIYLTDSYLKYMQDFGGVNEVLFVVEFTEVVNGNSGDTVTKVLGPYKNLADRIKAPMLNKLLYGPKRMESDILSMNLKVYEYDLEENEDTASMLDFIATSANALNLSDPITQGEIQIAAEIGKTLVSMNENDVVLELDVDFVAGNKLYKPYSSSKVLPLKDGQLLVVKQEACRVGTCYGYFSDNGSNLPGILTDVVMFLPTAVMRATTDIPDSEALRQFDSEMIGASSVEVDKGKNEKSTKKTVIEKFDDKTWLRLSIVKGGDPSQWEKRKLLYPVEEELNKLLKNPNRLGAEGFLQQLESISNAGEKLLLQESNKLSLNSMTSNREIHFIKTDSQQSDLCINHDTNIQFKSFSARLLGAVSNNGALVSNGSTAAGITCFKLINTNKFQTSAGDFQVNYMVNGKSNSVIIPIRVVPTITSMSVTCKKVDNANSQIDVTTSGPEAISQVLVNNKNSRFKLSGTELNLESSSTNFLLKAIDVFGADLEQNVTCN